MEEKSNRSIWILFAILVAVAAVSVINRAWWNKELVPWRSDLTAARAEAQAGNKPLLLYFTADWCGPCQSLKRTTWANRDVEAALRDYVPVKIDIDAHPDLANQYRVQAVPHFVLIGADNRLKNVADGAMDSDRFLDWLRG